MPKYRWICPTRGKDEEVYLSPSHWEICLFCGRTPPGSGGGHNCAFRVEMVEKPDHLILTGMESDGRQIMTVG